MSNNSSKSCDEIVIYPSILGFSWFNFRYFIFIMFFVMTLCLLISEKLFMRAFLFFVVGSVFKFIILIYISMVTRYIIFRDRIEVQRAMFFWLDFLRGNKTKYRTVGKFLYNEISEFKIKKGWFFVNIKILIDNSINNKLSYFDLDVFSEFLGGINNDGIFGISEKYVNVEDIFARILQGDNPLN